MLCEKSITLTTNTGGAASGTIGQTSGKLLRIYYEKVDFDNGSTFTITAGTTGVSLWTQTGVNASETIHPRIQVQNGASGADLSFYDPYPMVRETISIAISAGGNTKSGTFHFLFEQD